MVEGLSGHHCLFWCYLGDLFVEDTPVKIVYEMWIHASLHNICEEVEPEAGEVVYCPEEG